MKNSAMIIIFLAQLTIIQSFNWISENTRFFSYNCLTLLQPGNTVKVIETDINR